MKVRPEVEPDKVKVSIENTALRIGQPTKFKVDSTEAGNGDLKVRILDNMGNEVDVDHDQNDYGKVYELRFLYLS